MKAKIEKGRLGEPSYKLRRPKQASIQASAHSTLHSCPDFNAMWCTSQAECSQLLLLRISQIKKETFSRFVLHMLFRGVKALLSAVDVPHESASIYRDSNFVCFLPEK